MEDLQALAQRMLDNYVNPLAPRVAKIIAAGQGDLTSVGTLTRRTEREAWRKKGEAIARREAAEGLPARSIAGVCRELLSDASSDTRFTDHEGEMEMRFAAGVIGYRSVGPRAAWVVWEPGWVSENAESHLVLLPACAFGDQSNAVRHACRDVRPVRMVALGVTELPVSD